MRKTFIFTLVTVCFGQTAVLEDFSSVRNAIGTSTPMWDVYTGQGGGGNPCSVQTWTISGGSGNDNYSANSCPYFNAVIGNAAGTPGGYNFPNGYTQAYLLSGSWTASFNRLKFSMTCTGNSWGVQNTTASVGTYIRDHALMDGTNQGPHYYHSLQNAVNVGQKYYFTLNAHPQHQVGNSSNINWPNDPEFALPTLGAVHYFDGLTRWYVNPYFTAGLANSGQCSYGEMDFAVVNNEPDEDVSTVTISYDGTTYHVDWAGPKNAFGGITETYTVRLSTSLSPHTWSSASACSGANNPATPGSAYTFVNYTCPHAPVTLAVFRIRPDFTVLGTTGNGVSPIRVSLLVDPMLATNDQVIVANVGGNMAANGTFNVTSVARQFFKRSDNTLTQIVVSGGAATATTSLAHNLQVGQVVMVYSASDANSWGTAPILTITSVSSSTTFGFTTTEPNGTYTQSDLQVWSQPAIDLQGSTGNGTWTNGGKVTATSDTKNFTEVSVFGGVGSTISSNSVLSGVIH